MYKRFHSHINGRGLGLYLVKEQMNTLKGKIQVESQINQGTSFILTFTKQSKVASLLSSSILEN